MCMVAVLVRVAGCAETEKYIWRKCATRWENDK